MLMSTLTSLSVLDEINRSQLLFLCVLPFLIGLGIYLSFIKRGKTTGLKKARFIALIPLVIGLVLGIFAMNNLRDPLYLSYNDVGSKFKLLHYGAFIAPLVGILMIVGAEFILRRSTPKSGL